MRWVPLQLTLFMAAGRLRILLTRHSTREWISVLCLNERYAVEPGVRLRPVPEMAACLAYTPARPALHRLNAASWLLVSLCDGRPVKAIIDGFRVGLGERAYAEAELHQGLEQLLSLGIIRRLPTKADAVGNQIKPADEETLR